MNDWSERHERLLAEADPRRADALDDTTRERVWLQVRPDVNAPVRPKRSSRALIAGGVAAVLLGVGGAATASVLSSRTGEVADDPESILLGGPGEYLALDGADYIEVVAEETDDIPFPSNSTRQISLDLQEQDSGEPGVVSTGAVRGFVANDAICSWANAWARATREGDPEGVAAATAMLDSSSSWESVKTLQDIEPVRFDWLPGVQQAAHGTSVPRLGESLAEEVFCARELVPNLPQAIPADLEPCQASVYRTCTDNVERRGNGDR